MRFKTGQKWFDDLMPEGFHVPSSTLVSGPGGSGKPLVGYSIVTPWLKKGGDVIFVLTSTGQNFVKKAMKEIYNVDIDDYKGNLKFVDFDIDLSPSVDAIEVTGDGTNKANLVNPEVWDNAIQMANNQINHKSESGTLVFASALNLFLFSKTYGESILKRLREIVEEDKNMTYLFTVSTSAYKEKIGTLEEAADNLMFTRTEKPMKLFLKITKMKEVNFSKQEIEVPLTTEDLQTIKSLAEESRTNLIPRITKI